MKSKLKVIAYLCALTLIIILIFIFTNQKNQQTFKIDSPEIDVKSEQNPTSPPNQKSSSDSTQQQTLTPPQQPVSSNNDIAKDPYNAETKNSINNEQFKEINENMKKEIYEKMRVDEIKSLKESVINDKKLLKKIEDSGTGIEDYKFIQQNLKKRLDRLKVLESKYSK